MKKNVHVVPHQHFDLIWRRELKWYQKRREKLFLQVLALLQRIPQAHFTFSQAIAMREFIKEHPSCREIIKKFLQSGRLEIIGGSESICDLNMVSGAAIMRNISMGREWFKKEFSYEVKVGAFEDAFGLSKQVAQIIKLSGYEFYKADRVPLADGSTVRGDFVWETATGEKLRCVAPAEKCSIWGWGESDDPDDHSPVSQAEKRDKLYRNLAKAADFEGENCLFTLVGEEHSIFLDLPSVLEELSNTFKVNYKFSTFEKYYNSLPEEYWDKVPCYPAESDFSRLFTGCYASRRASKTNAKILENSLLRAEMDAGLKNQEISLQSEWRALFMLQFHDAICGCHIDENAAELEQIKNNALKNISPSISRVVWPLVLPEISIPQKIRDIKPESRKIDFEDYQIKVSNGRLESISKNNHTLGNICNIVLREEHGTLWTEEYSGRQYLFDQPEKISKITSSNNMLEIITETSLSSTQRKLWVGMAKIAYRKHYRFFTESGLCLIKIELDFLGNSTEIALRWHSNPLEHCLAEIPFGSMKRTGYEATDNLMTGDTFPALNWVKTDEFVTFNTATPSHAIREKRLENILLRSPVKRWSPWFPVTPSDKARDNGKHSFSFLWGNSGFVQCSNADLHRAGMEFNLGALEYKADPRLSELPENVVVASYRKAGGKLELLLFEANGESTRWEDNACGISEDFMAYEIKFLRV